MSFFEKSAPSNKPVSSFLSVAAADAGWARIVLFYLFKIVPIITGVYGLTTAVFSAVKINYDSSFILTLAFAAVCGFTLLQLNTIITYILSAVCLTAAAYTALPAILDNTDKIPAALIFFNDYYVYLVQTVGFASSNQPSRAVSAVLANPAVLQLYAQMASAVLAAAFSLIVSFFSFKKPMPFFYLLICIAALSPFLYFGIISSQMSIYLISISVFCTYANKIYNGWYEKNTENQGQPSPLAAARGQIKAAKAFGEKMNARKKYIMLGVFDGKIAITAFLISLGAIFMINFYYMSGVEKTDYNRIFSDVVDVVTSNINKDDIGNAFGVGNDIGQGKINENGVDLSNTKLLKIFPSDTDTIYLRSWVGANYSNDRWTSLSPDKTDEFRKLAAAGVNPQNILRNFLWITKGVNINKNYKYTFDQNLGLSFIRVGIAYVQIRTGLLCVPPMFISNSLDSKQLLWGYTGDGIYSVRRNLLDQPVYFVDTVIPKYNTDGFKKTFLNKQAEYEKLAADVKKTMDSPQGQANSDTSYSLIRDELLYRRFVYQSYLNVPENMSGELTRLAQKIVGNSKTTFEKAEKIRVYLAQNYSYNLTPPSSQKTDSVYCFLFESKQGFCSHYASSMTLLLRTLGIPARYSTGYVVQTKDYGEYAPTLGLTEQNIIDRSGITVYPRYAHAWCEVYFDGIGWLPFEATTSFSNPMHIEQSQAGQTAPQSFEYDTHEEFEDELPPVLGEGIEVDTSKINYKFIFEVALLVFSAVLMLVFIRAFALLLLAKYNTGIRREMFEQFDKRDAVNDIFEYIISISQKHILKINPGELLMDYAKRIDLQINDSKIKFAKIIPIAERSLFSRHEITETDRTAVILYASRLREHILEGKKPFERFILKYFDSTFNF